MANPSRESLFLDTSIQIARLVHGPMTKRKIRERIGQHGQVVTGLIVRQEFKRRLLKEAAYLLRLLHQYDSFGEVNQHVIRLFGPWPSRVRKRNICLQILAQEFDGSDRDKTDRLRLYLRSLLVNGLRQFDQFVDQVATDSACGCGQRGVVERVPLRDYKLGEEHCSRTRAGECGIVSFLKTRREHANRVLQLFRSLPEERKSREIKASQQFLERLVDHEEVARQEDPCLKVGDLMIALESVGIPHFFTLNGVESQHLCRALDQELIVRPIDPLRDDVICARDDPHWPQFGRMAGPDSNSGSDVAEK